MVVLLAFVLSPLARGDAPTLIHQERIPIPTDACSHQRGACQVKLHFVVQLSGQPSNIQIAGSSGYRECDMTAIQVVSKRLYRPVNVPVTVSESVRPYSCSGYGKPFHVTPAGS
jgi:TonB family protein